MHFLEAHLRMACKHDHPKVVEYFLTDLHVNPNAKMDNQPSPLSLAKSKQVIILLLQNGIVAKDAYAFHRKTLSKVFSKEPLKSPVRMFVIGDGGEGKSTLIEAMEHEPTRFAPLVNFFVAPKEVDGVSQKTAGIIPRVFKSRFYGDVLFYDFAGQEAYYSSHAAVIKSAVDTCPPIFILVIGLHRKDTAITHSVLYWLGIIVNQCANLEGKAHLIVIGSHADLVKEEVDMNRKKQIIFRAVQKFAAFSLVNIIPTDCRYSNSPGMKVLRRCVGKCCDSIRSKLSVSLNSHMFLIYLLDKHSTEAAFSLEKIHAELITESSNQTQRQKIKQAIPYIPTTIPRLIEICTQLNDKGHILFLLDESSLEKSFIIVNKLALLAEINGTMFAPEDFTQHCKLATSTGVVRRSKLAEHFPKFNTKMLVRFLAHFELAVPIKDQEVLSLVSQHLGESTTSTSEEYFFCPALIRLEVPSEVFTYQVALSYHFGWIMSCVHSDDFFDARFLHVLILRLALSLGLAPVVDPDIPSLQHQCSVWKTGVSWYTTDGVKVLVEVVNKKKVVVLIQAHANSFQLYKLRSQILQKVRGTTVEFCSSVVTEELILSPADVVYPIEESLKIAFSLRSVAETVLNQKPFVLSACSGKIIRFIDLLPVEVYANLGESILQPLLNETHPAHDEKVSDSFLSALCSSWGKSADLEDLICSAIMSNIKVQSSGKKLRVALGTWRYRSDGTYRSLRRVLDPLSVFAGKNPLVS